VLGFPDYRTTPPREISFDEDLRLADALDRAAAGLNFDGLVDLFYRLRPPARPGLQRKHRTHFDLEAEQAEAAMGRLEQAGPGPLLDVGCGMGRYLAAGARRGRLAVGVDVAVYQLVLARKFLQEQGLEVQLCLANAEALPFEDAAFATAVGTDLLEHVDEPSRTIREIGRVLRPGGGAFFTTPNRFSLTPEPHVGIWGLGYLPRNWAEALVRRQLGVDYGPIRPLSYDALRGLLQNAFPGSSTIELPKAGAKELAGFAPGKRMAAHVYVGLADTPVLRSAVARVAPYFVAIGAKGQ
jgi:SAM-dependent methyltransferase